MASRSWTRWWHRLRRPAVRTCRACHRPRLELLEDRRLLATIVDLGTLGGASSYAYAVNAYGQVTGFSEVPGVGYSHAFFWDGSMTDLGTLGGYTSVGSGLNDSGAAVGYSLSSGSNNAQAFLDANGTMSQLFSLPEYESHAYGINNSGQVVGDLYHTSAPAYYHAFFWDSGTLTDLGTLGGSTSLARAVNDAGQVAGYSYTPGAIADIHAFLYSAGVMNDLGTLPGGTWSYAYGLNASGQVVGESRTSPASPFDPHAFLYSDGTMTDLGILPGGRFSHAYGVNSYGEVVGAATSYAQFADHAFFYSGGTMVDLNSLLPSGSGWTLTEADAINDGDQIVGHGTHDGQVRAFLMTLDTGRPGGPQGGAAAALRFAAPETASSSLASLAGTGAFAAEPGSSGGSILGLWESRSAPPFTPGRPTASDPLRSGGVNQWAKSRTTGRLDALGFAGGFAATAGARDSEILATISGEW